MSVRKRKLLLAALVLLVGAASAGNRLTAPQGEVAVAAFLGR